MIKTSSVISMLVLIGIVTACAKVEQVSDNSESSTSDVATAVQGQATQTTPAPLTRAVLDQSIERHTLAFMKAQPILSTLLDIDQNAVGGSYNNRFPDYSPSGMRFVQSLMRDAIQELSALDGTGLGKDDSLHLKTVLAIENYYAGSDRFPAGYIDTWGGHLPYIVNQISGPLIDIPKAMQVQQRVESKQDALDYLSRLGGFQQLVDQVLKKVRADENAGVILPQKLYPKTLSYFEKFFAAQAEQHPLVTTFATRLDKVESLSAEEKAQLVEKAAVLVDDTVYPAYKKIAAFMAEQQNRAPSEDGIWGQPGGNDFYRHEIRNLGDSPLSADEIHQIGLREVKRLSVEMDTILKDNGIDSGSVGERMMALTDDPRFLYQDTDDGRAKLLEALNQQVNDVMAKAPSMFATLPQAKVEVRRIPVVSEAGEAGGFYTSPSLDGTRPGIYWINLRDMKANPSFSLKTLTYHEAVPGHHFQIALNMAQKDIGLFRQNAPFNAYVEGWALYSELLANEMGMYQDDPWGNLGRLQAELYRAVRLVVDTGLHAKQWTREQAIDYFYKTAGTPMSDVVAEVERYMAWPGQALGYKIGMLQLVKLREWAHSELGEQFDIRGYHDVILLPGARPMALVKDDVEAWVKGLLELKIATKKAKEVKTETAVETPERK